MSEKLQKVGARLGLASRRALEEWIKAGRFRINGRIAVLGDRVTATDHITLDGQPLRVASSARSQESLLLMYHKPVGEICSRSDPEQRPTVFEKLPKLRHQRWISIGRLDFNTSGLLLLTTDGELAHRLMHPSTQIEREYAVRVLGPCSKAVLERLERGVRLEDGLARAESIQDAGGEGANHWYHIVVKEGRNRLVRRLFESQGLRVSRLIRIRFGALTLPRHLRPGRYQKIAPSCLFTERHL